MATRTFTMTRARQPMVVTFAEPPAIRQATRADDDPSSDGEEDGNGASSSRGNRMVKCELGSVFGVTKITRARKLDGSDDIYALQTYPPPRDVIKKAPISTVTKNHVRKELVRRDKIDWVFVKSPNRPRKGRKVYLARCDNIPGEHDSVLWMMISAKHTLVRQFNATTRKTKKTRVKKTRLTGREFLERRVAKIETLLGRFEKAIKEKDPKTAGKILDIFCRYPIKEQRNRDKLNRFAKKRFKIDEPEEMLMPALCKVIRGKLYS